MNNCNRVQITLRMGLSVVCNILSLMFGSLWHERELNYAAVEHLSQIFHSWFLRMRYTLAPFLEIQTHIHSMYIGPRK